MTRVGIAVSAVVAIVILAVGLVRYLDDDEAVAEPFEASRVVDDAIVRVVATPGAAGPTDLHLYVEDPAAGLEEPTDARAELTLEGDVVDVELIDSGVAHWLAEDIDLRAGAWTLEVSVTRADGTDIETTFAIPIGGTS
ncbi:MAG TPA: hypothetical protein VFU93_00895 [Acidimicrobiales bacterium]|nr:hypothetical protein [Acidimicrobiales bacterium]